MRPDSLIDVELRRAEWPLDQGRDREYPPRQVAGFYKQVELASLIHLRKIRKALAELP